MKPPVYNILDDSTLVVTQELPTRKAGAPTLSRIFNFKARQLITLYEAGQKDTLTIPYSKYGDKMAAGHTSAFTSSMQVQNFSDLDNAEELAEMHEKLTTLGGKPPPLENLSKPSRVKIEKKFP